MEQKRVLAMYDVRGIQEYIFRTAKVKDAIGASGLVENIISKALSEAVRMLKREEDSITSDLVWYDRGGVCPYTWEDQKDIQVLYIGGGNAFCTYKNGELCVRVNKYMSKYIIDQTYSLQLAIAVVPCTGDYQVDYKNVFDRMNQVKERMIISRPLCALPVMQRDVKTGYPIPYEEVKKDFVNVEESLRKRETEWKLRGRISKDEKIFDNYITEKGLDSTLAVVHIDGNNMGLRIRTQIQKIKHYDEAVMVMRRISYRINHAYKKVFQQMKTHFDEMEKDKRKNSVLKILVAGDDITYICNGKIALDTVEYFAKEIVHYTMDGKKEDIDKKADVISDKSICEKKDGGYHYPLEKETDMEKLKSQGFSVCAGIAYINSHFPFYVGYETAEECCASAKERAKREEYRGLRFEDGKEIKDRIGNWVDFQICKNVQAQNLKRMREKEYVTKQGEELMLRPYFIKTECDFDMMSAKEAQDRTRAVGQWEEKTEAFCEHARTLESFKENILFFQNADLKDREARGDQKGNLPRRFSKLMRNTYSQGRMQMLLLNHFLESRGWMLPDGKNNLYYEKDGVRIAKWYDALEMFDYQTVYKKSEDTEAGEKNE